MNKESNNKKILLVEDDQEIQELLTVFLEKNGFDVTACSNGIDAVERFKKSSFCAAIVDVMIPGKDGYTIVQEIRSIETSASARMPVIMLSALAQQEEIDKGMAAGADIYLTKPYENAYLLEQLRKILSS